MSNFLTEHAADNVWCTPDQDYQHTYQVARITGRLGVRRKIDVEWQNLNLPNPTDKFHVYSIGQIHPRLLGLLTTTKVWTPFSEVCAKQTMLVDIFQKDGFEFPLHMAYLCVMGDRNIIIALKDDVIFGNRYLNPVFFKVYSNAYFTSLRSTTLNMAVKVEGYHYWGDRQELLNFQSRFRDYQAKVGHVKAFRNGFLIDDFQPDRFAVGDILEYVYDSSIYKVVDLVLDNLETFTSTLDQVQKYLIHYPGIDNNIIYHDDIDIFLVKKFPNGRYEGLYHHKNSVNTIRMVTHRDYSLTAPYVVGFIHDHATWTNSVDISVRLYLRNSGYVRPLVNEHHRINELYKLPPELILKAMVGVDSSIVLWRAAELENSFYPRLMRAVNDNFNKEDVERAYGYNAISTIIGDTPQRISADTSDGFVKLPYILQQESTVMEHSAEGLLLGYGVHTSGQYYAPLSPNTKMVEVVSGIGATNFDIVYDAPTFVMNPTYTYRFYKCQRLTGKWVSAVEDVDYVITDQTVVWLVDTVVTRTANKSDRRFLLYTFKLNAQQGVLNFTLTNNVKEGNVYLTQPLGILPGKLELWLNGKALIADLDYYYNGVEVYIVNKEYQVAGEQTVVVRGTGFCEPDMTLEQSSETGWVTHGLLSKNNHYDVRNDKVMRFVVKGLLKTRDDIAFAEDHSGIVVKADVKNGSPYIISDIIVPARGLTKDDSYILRTQSREIDALIGNYLTIRKPQPVINDISAIPERYRLFSPFAARVLYDLKSGYLWNEQMKGHYNEMDIRNWVSAYTHLLDFDPCTRNADLRFVSVHPHDLYVENELNVYQYNFLKRVIKYYLNDKVDLSHFVAIKDGWL